MAYATIDDVLARTTRTFNEEETTVINSMLDDAALIIDGYNANASPDAKKVVSCRMVLRVVGDDGNIYPLGATQGSMAAGGYSQSWTIGSGGGSGELYLGKTDKAILGGGDRIGSYSPVEELAPPILMPLCLGVGWYD